MRHHDVSVCERDSGNQNVIRSDALTLFFEIRSDLCRPFRCNAIQRQNLEGGIKFSANE